MSFEDIIRVADLKTRPARFERVRSEARAKVGEPLVVIDFLKPGLEEFASLLPPGLGRRVLDWAGKNGKLHAYNVGMHIKTSSVLGYLTVRSLAWCALSRTSALISRARSRLLAVRSLTCAVALLKPSLACHGLSRRRP